MYPAVHSSLVLMFPGSSELSKVVYSIVKLAENPSSVQPGSVGPGSQQPGSVQSQEENTKEYNDLVRLFTESPAANF